MVPRTRPGRSRSHASRRARLPVCPLLLLTSALFFLPVAPLKTHGQAAPDTSQITEDLEETIEGLASPATDATDLVESLTDLATHPLDVNHATAQALAQIPSLDLPLARRIVDRRDRKGPFRNLDELKEAGLTADLLARTRRYLYVGAVPPEDASAYPPAPSLSHALANLNVEVLQRVTRRLDAGRGYTADTSRTTYLGSPEQLYTRLRLRHKRNVSVNLTLEKDPGEVFGWNPASRTYGFDFWSAHAALQDFGRLRTLVVGDFVAAFGQGLVLWRNGAFGKGADVVNAVPRRGSGIRPYASSDENNFFRGAAATVRVTPSLSATMLASSRRRDATTTVAPGTTDADETGASFSLTGLHRTPAELSRKGILLERIAGGGLEFAVARARAGLITYYARFDPPLLPRATADQRFAFHGREIYMTGGYFDASLGDVLLFGEAARAPGNVLGGLGGLSVSPTTTVTALLLFRHYPRDFVSLHGHAFGERNGATQNETGFYSGLQLRPSPAWTISAYFDQFTFPWLRYGVPRPSRGYEAFLQAEHQARRWFTYYVQLRTETKEAGTAVRDQSGRMVAAVAPETRQSMRVQGTYSFSRRLRLRTRLELVRFLAPNAARQHGLLVYQDLRWRALSKLQVDLRFALFDTDSYDARVYAYENDLLYQYAAPALSGQGQRTYILLSYALLKTLSFQVKVAQTRYEAVDTVGSGLDMVQGDQVRDVKAQLRLRL